MSNWIIPFILGVFVGQEFKEAPKVRPYLEAGVRKIIEVSRDIFNNAQVDEDEKYVDKDKDSSDRKWWRK